MLSILIPTYNYNALPLAKEIHKQASVLKIGFELICIDDGSKSYLNIENHKINKLANAQFIANKTNLGRSGIRNFLADKAKFEFLLFLDSDVEIFNPNFLKNYINSFNEETEIIYGGIEYQKNKPNNNQLLRWVYGNKREALKIDERIEKPYLRFLTLNFIIKKDVFKKIRFNESIPNLRSEDLIFAMDAKKHKIKLKHIDNPVIHLGIENSEIFLLKTKKTLEALDFILKNQFLGPNDASITRFAHAMQKFKLSFVFKFIWSVFGKAFEKNLLSSKPSLLIFDLYRLCYFLKLKNKN